jgi:hypothetical protein
MKITKIILLSLICFLFLTAIAIYIIFKINKENEIKIVDGKVNFIIKPEFQNYLLNQDIYAKLRLVNRTSEPFQFAMPLDIWFLKVTGPDGNDLSGSLEGDFPSLLDTVLLFPGQSLERIINLDPFLSDRYVFNTSGKYIISAKFHGIESNAATFNLIHPAGTDLKIYNEFFKTGASFNKTEIIEQYIKEGKSSPYFPRVYYNELSYKRKNENEKMKEKMYDFYFLNFNDYYNRSILHNYGVFLTYSLNLPRQEIENRLSELEENYAGTKIAEYNELERKHNEFIKTNSITNYR